MEKSLTTEVGEPEAQLWNRVYVIDDDSDVRKSLHFLLSASSITVWPFASAADFLDQLADLAPAPILLDIRMADIDGLQVLAILQERDVRWPVIVMTAHGDVKVAVRAMKLGAIEFIEKPFSPDLLLDALDLAFGLLGQIEHSDHAREAACQLFGQLSAREHETIALLMEGHANKAVAHRLGLSVRTVEMHRANALGKLEVRSIAQVVALAATAELETDTDSPVNDA